jgi:hypothetical protein
MSHSIEGNAEIMMKLMAEGINITTLHSHQLSPEKRREL